MTILRAAGARVAVVALVLASLPCSAPAAEEEAFDVEPSAETPPQADPADALFWEAVLLLDSTDAGQQRRGQQLLREAADREHVGAQGYLGECHFYGTGGFSQRQRRGVEWFRLAAQQGYPTAKAMLGICYASGTGVRRDPKAALQWLREAVAEAPDFVPLTPPQWFLERQAERQAAAAAPGPAVRANPAPWEGLFAFANYHLAAVLESMNEPEEALRHYEKAAFFGDGARSGIYEAARKAAMGYALGRGTKRDLARANELLAHSRTLVRRTALASFHAQWSSRQVDEFDLAQFEEAVATAADQQLLIEQQNVADALIREQPAEAIRWCELAAENAEPWAMLKLAELKFAGVGGPVDQAAAFHWYEKAAREADLEMGWGNLAVCLQHGFGTEADQAAANEIIAARRDENFICALAGAGRMPEQDLSYSSWLRLLEHCARRERLPEAQYHYALQIMREEEQRAQQEGKPVRGGRSIVRLLEAAAAAGVVEANYYLGRMYEIGGFVPVDFETAWRRYEAGDRGGSAMCAYHIGSLAAEGRGRPFNPALAVRAFLRAIERDPEHAAARNDLAVLYEHLISQTANTRERNEYKASLIQRLKEADAMGDPYAAFNLGRHYLEDRILERDFRTAYDHFQTAAERGHTVANRYLGHMHNYGHGVPETPKEALYYYRLAALGGDVAALREVCAFYLQGRGVELDLERAASWLALLAQQGDVHGLLQYGDVLLDRELYDEAYELWTDLARSTSNLVRGYADERLSRIYRDGLGVRPDERRAGHHFERAVAAANPDALCRVGRSLLADEQPIEALNTLDTARKLGSSEAAYLQGCLLFSGEGVPRDVARAWTLIRNAAEGGHLEAQYNLAISTLTETEGAPGIAEAIRWAEKAEAAGHPEAGKVRRKLEDRREKSTVPANANRSHSG